MRLFSCETCNQMVYFENVHCERCHGALGYLAGANHRMLTLKLADKEVMRSADGSLYRYCDNSRFGACNWLVPAPSDGVAAQTLCQACELNRTIPDVNVTENQRRWVRLELAKHRLVYSLHRLGLPVLSGHQQPGGLLFDFLADVPGNDQEKVVTGHSDGVITVDLSEADAAVRTQRRQQLGERFRTLLGHFRHEIGHYYWFQLCGSTDVAAFRDQFGDETRDYESALRSYYRDGPVSDWNQRFVSPYASSHPHEDWAETFAHYLHIVDTLDSASAFRIGLHSRATTDLKELVVTLDSYSEPGFEKLWDAWLPLTFAVNALNRSMGNDDLYPFVLTPAAIDKLRFVHNRVRRCGGGAQGGR